MASTPTGSLASAGLGGGGGRGEEGRGRLRAPGSRAAAGRGVRAGRVTTARACGRARVARARRTVRRRCRGACSWVLPEWSDVAGAVERALLRIGDRVAARRQAIGRSGKARFA